MICNNNKIMHLTNSRKKIKYTLTKVLTISRYDNKVIGKWIFIPSRHSFVSGRASGLTRRYSSRASAHPRAPRA